MLHHIPDLGSSIAQREGAKQVPDAQTLRAYVVPNM